MNDDPIREEKTLFEKFRDRLSKGKKKKIFLTTYNPYTKKEQDKVIGSYFSKDEEQIINAFKNLGITAMTTENKLRKLAKLKEVKKNKWR